VNTKSLLSAFLTAILLSGLILVVMRFGTVQASTGVNDISKPSVPEFTVKFIKSSYNVTTIDPSTGASVTEQKDNNTIEIIIKNQPFTPYSVGSKGNSTITSHYFSLYYNVRTKGHFEYNWTEQYPSWSYPPQSNLEYTVLSLPHLVQLPYNYNVAGGQIDFQVEAIIGNITIHWVFIHNHQPLSGSGERIWTIEQTSGWSNTQTLTLPEDYIPPTPEDYIPSTSPPPTITPYQEPEQTEQLEIITSVALAVAVIGAGLGLLIYLIKRK